MECYNVRNRPLNFGDAVQESAEAKAERILKTELKRMGWREKELGERRKGDPGKVRLAQHLRANTTMSLAWIAARLQMGVHGHVSHLLYWQGKEKPDTKRKTHK